MTEAESIRRDGVAAALACPLLVLVALPCRGAETVVPRVESPPALDGALDDECWKRALALADCTQPKSNERPAKRVGARLCFDRRALYVSFTCEEPRPDGIKAEATREGMTVWEDDCVEVWVRTTGSALEFDQFIVNTLGTRESLRRRQSPGADPWKPSWRAAARVGRAEWTAELAIPFADLDVKPPARGDMFEIKLGREDRAGGGLRLATWPPRSRYAGPEDYAPVYFESANLLRNPDMSEEDRGKVASWSFSRKGADRGLFSSALPAAPGVGTAQAGTGAGRNVIRFEAPGRYSIAQQDLRLKANALYRLEALVRGGARVYLRARTVLKEGGPSVPHTVTSRPSPAEFVRCGVTFPTGPTGKALVIFGSTEDLGKGRVEIADLRVAREVGYRDFGEAVPLRSGEETVVTKLLVADCRALRGFLGTPVDGSCASRDWAAREYEYNRYGRASAGVGYSYNGNDGLHITFADREGFDAMVIRGGARVKLYGDCPRYDSPDGGKLLCGFPGRTTNSRTLFENRVVTDRVSFFELAEGVLANVSFFRIGRGRDDLPEPERREVGGPVGDFDDPELEARFPRDGRRTYGIHSGLGRDTRPIAARAREALHFATPPLDRETPLAAVGLDLVIWDCRGAVPFTAAVQDSLNPRSELFGADFVLDKPGRLRFVMDFPDQVVPRGARLWLTLRLGVSAKLAGPGGGAPVVELYRVPRMRALPEALAYRKLLMNTYFCSLSEARPWNHWYTDGNIEKSMRTEYGPQLRELVATVDHCRALDADDPTVRQYYEWIWRRHRPWRKERGRGIQLDASHARIDPVPGAPEWAVVARQAWLEARKVPAWWIENRMVPTGELGGEVGDDTDMYQNFADFPMFETGGVAAKVLDGAERLAEFAERENLEQGLNRNTTDPLHAYEEGVNHLALMAAWHYGNPVYLERCMVNARSTEKLTVVTAEGHRHFRSQTMGASDLRMERKTDQDGHAHPLMLHPAFEVAWYNANPRVLKFLREWADGWLAHQKPGEYATSVDVATESVKAKSGPPLYGGYGAQGSAFRFLHRITGDDRYLRPYREYIAAGGTYAMERLLSDLARSGGLGDVRAKAAGTAKGRGAVDFVLNGDKAALVEAFKVDIAEMQNYRAMYTTSEPFTDRVFLQAIRSAAIAYTGGYATRNKYDRSHAVSWEGFGTDYAALVVTARAERLKALVYSFADGPVEGRLRLWRLEHGRYRVATGPDADRDDAADRLEREEELEITRGSAVGLTLAPGTVTVVELAKLERLDDIRLRADLALSPREVRLEGRTVRGLVHNIGSRPVDSFEVALVDARGAVRERRRMGPIEAPLDLLPRKLEFALPLPPAFFAPREALAWTVRVDPRGDAPEIYEGNNTAPVRRP